MSPPAWCVPDDHSLRSRGISAQLGGRGRRFAATKQKPGDHPVSSLFAMTPAAERVLAHEYSELGKVEPADDLTKSVGVVCSDFRFPGECIPNRRR